MNTLSINSCGIGSSLKNRSIKTLCIKYGVSFLGIQETHLLSIDLLTVKSLWGTYNFDFACNSSRGRSGGILSVWDPSVFSKRYLLCTDNVLIVGGYWLSLNIKFL
jgi:hypothetical protein